MPSIFFLNTFFFVRLVSWSFWSQWYLKTTTRHPDTTPAPAPKPTTQKHPKASRIYIVNEIVDDAEKSNAEKDDSEQLNAILVRSKINASDPASFGINWDRIPYNDFSERVASISKLLILIMPVLLVFIF